MKVGIGHNSTAEQLKSVVERIERLEEERKGLGADVREIYAEAKGNGFDPKILRQIIRLRRMAESDRREQEELLDTYLSALGMTPLEQRIKAVKMKDLAKNLSDMGAEIEVTNAR